MASSKPQSVTLPRNFTFHYTDGQLPTTPEPAGLQDPLEPPLPPRQIYRVRRRRAPLPAPESSPFRPSARADIPIPTIEAHEVASEKPDTTRDFSSAFTEGYLTPEISFNRSMSHPATPIAQISILGGGRLQTQWDSSSATHADTISRPSTACSGFSDSSGISSESAESYPSFGGSCTSPESDAADPFVYTPAPPKPSGFVSSGQSEDQRPAKRMKARDSIPWTMDMDNHLWATYLKYLQDPTVTPFKTLPGTAPPLGVCHRVVREAKRTWKGPKTSVSRRYPRKGQSQSQMRCESPDTIKPSTESGSTTPTAPTDRTNVPQWPSSDSAARRRLRELCKRKPSLSAHYQRLLSVRSPSPFQSSSRAGSTPRACRLSSPFGSSSQYASFSTRDMNVSLATSTSATMQLGNPLSQLTAHDRPSTPRNNEWFNEPIGRSGVHQKSQSLQLGLGLGPNSHHVPIGNPSLGSPFHNPPQAHACDNADPFVGASTATASGPTLDPPFELHAPRPLPRSFKRRARHLEDEYGYEPGLRQDLLQHLFGAPADISHRRVRSRGFSLGDIGEGAHRLSSLFTPPNTQPEPATNAEATMMAPPCPDVKMSSPPTDNERSLGSPFAEKLPEGHFNTFPRNFSGSGVFASTSIESRLNGFVEDYFPRQPSLD